MKVLTALTLALLPVVQSQLEFQKVVGCYYNTFTYYSKGEGQFSVDDVDPSLCTHGFYCYADMNEQNQIFSLDPYLDLEATDEACPNKDCLGFYKKFTDFKSINNSFHPILTIGGWNAGSAKFSAMAKDPAKRATFISSTLAYVKKYNFDGIEFDWEYPGVRNGSDPENDKDNLNLLAKELRAAFAPEQLILIIAINGAPDRLDLGFDVVELNKHVDYMTALLYDFNGGWNDYTGHNSPLFRTEEEANPEHPAYMWNVHDSIDHMIKVGADPNKIIMGLPSYGRGVQLADPEVNGLYCPAADEPLPPGPFSNMTGVISFMAIMKMFNSNEIIYPGTQPGKDNWTIVVDDCVMSPYMYQGKYWIGFDNENSLALKTQFANLKGLAGVALMTMEGDDFRGSYTGTPFPLLKRMFSETFLGTTFDPLRENCVGTAPVCDLLDGASASVTSNLALLFLASVLSVLLYVH